MFIAAALFLLQATYPRVILPPPEPPFQRYPAPDAITGSLALPKISNAQERRFRTELTRAITKGYDVVDGGTEHDRIGPNFAGRYVLVQWGCGSNCMQAAIIDGRDGSVLRLPQIPGETLGYFDIPTGSTDRRTLRFRWNSNLLGIPRAADGMTYYYVLDGHQWRFIRKDKTPQEHL